MNLGLIKRKIFLAKQQFSIDSKLKTQVSTSRSVRVFESNKQFIIDINEKWNLRKKEELESNTGEPRIGVVIAHYNENLSWLPNIKYKCRIISKYGLPKETAPNKGNEASSFLQYIINNYESLDDYTIFVHGHRTAWHHVENTDVKINRLEFVHPYYNINDGGLRSLVSIPEWHRMRYMIPPVTLLFGTFVNLKDVKFRNSAQFYVHKDNILRHSKETYQKLYEYLMKNNESSYWTGRVFEYLWHVIFTGNICDIP
jgi:hypothetical protein